MERRLAFPKRRSEHLFIGHPTLANIWNASTLPSQRVSYFFLPFLQSVSLEKIAHVFVPGQCRPEVCGFQVALSFADHSSRLDHGGFGEGERTFWSAFSAIKSLGNIERRQ